MARHGLTDTKPAKSEPLPDYSPEARRQRAKEATKAHVRLGTRIGPGSRAFEVVKRVAVGTINDGTIHAGNLAYMSILAIFPFFILAAAVFSAIGEEAERMATISTLLAAMPPVVREVIAPVAHNVVEARSGWLLWVGGAIGLWTVGSLVETIRDILRRAYGTRPTHAFWKYRIFSTGIILVAVLLLMLSLIAQVLIGAAQQVIEAYFPELTEALGQLAWSRIASAVGVFGSIWMLFVALTPAPYRRKLYPKWPGALLVGVWWILVTLALPPVLRSLFTYNLTYGSLAGFMIALFFFWLVGLGMVAGAELNAALAETPEERRNRLGDVDGEGPDEEKLQNDEEDNRA